MDAPLMTAVELADHYGLCRATIYNLLPKGLPSIKIGRARRFRLADVDAWLISEDTRGAA